jgi:hypothetical protein
VKAAVCTDEPAWPWHGAELSLPIRQAHLRRTKQSSRRCSEAYPSTYWCDLSNNQ